MYKTISFVFFFILLVTSALNAQKGKDGAKTVSTANSKINEFTALTTNAFAGSTLLNVTASSLNANARFTSTLSVGDLVMIIQMQGALMKLSPVPVWAPDSTYGRIYDYGSCGNYEFAQVKSVISATQIELDCGLAYNYSSTGKTQVVRVPRYSSLNVTSTGTLTTDAWNGTIGGILVAEIDGNTTINVGGLVTVTGLGFRGGIALGNGGSGNGNYATINPNDGAEKGEGIGSHRLSNSGHDTLGKQCMGAPANGGGGGNANNCGGGGGANAGDITNWNGYGVLNTTYSAIFELEYLGRGAVTSSGGGKGGYGTSTTNSNPAVNGPNNATAWGSFRRPALGGFGGRPLDYGLGKLFMGGGGGAGHKSANQSNGTNACSGGAGGGLIYFLNYGTISGSGTITANGANGNNAFGSSLISSQGIDGAGGAGGGGAVILNSTGAITSIVANANGGNGGNQIKSGLSSTEGQGPGGGGGGGYIASNGSAFTQNVNAGTNGTTNANAFSSTFPMNGATSGNIGLSNQIIPNYSYSLTTSLSQTLCTGNSASLTASALNTTATILWFNSLAGGNAIATGTAYTTPIYSVANTYTVYVGSCPGIYRQPIIITVNSGGSLSVSNQTICAGQSVTLTAIGGATDYLWNTGAITSSIVASPTVSTNYTVTGASGTCTSLATASVIVNTNLTIVVNSPSICAGQTATLIANGASTYTWSNSANSNSITVNPNGTTIYTVNGTSSACSGSTIATVIIYGLPTITVNSATICTGQTATLTANGAGTYTWNTGETVNSIFPTIAATYSVFGTDANGCTNIQTVTVTAFNTPSISVNSETICIGNSALLMATGATSYTWNTTAISNTISVSPTTTTIYTVISNSNMCFSQSTSTVFVTNTPTISVSSSSTLCESETATLTANGATTYTWSNGFIGNSQSVSPMQTSTYTVIGSVSNCQSLAQTLTISIINITADFTMPNSPVSVNNSINLVNTSVNAINYNWKFCNGNNSTNTNETLLLANSGTCCVTLIATNGTCEDSIIKCIEVINEATILIPNVFTPNGDGKNDNYKIYFSGIKTISLTIYNRWGAKIAEVNSANNNSIEWNGLTTANTSASDGTYYFLLEYTDLKDNSKTEKGFLNLFRN